MIKMIRPGSVALLFILMTVTLTGGVAQADKSGTGAMTGPQLQRALQAGFEALAEERLDRAERIFRETLRRMPGQHQARFGLGTLYVKKKEYERAIDILSGLLNDHPDRFIVLNNLAWVYATASDTRYRDAARAVAMAQEALLMQPQNYHVWSTLAQGHYMNGDFERAERAAREALRLGTKQEAPALRIVEYREQIVRCQRAVQAFSILEH